MKIILQFKNSKDLWEFKKATGADCVQLFTEDSTLICDCEEVDIALAVKEYYANVKETHAVALALLPSLL